MVDTAARRTPVARPVATDEVDVSGLVEWARRRDPVRWTLGGIIAVWALTFFLLCKLRHDRFGTFSFDLGIYDQALWLLARFETFNTVKGLNIFGHHMNLILAVLAPFYRLGAGPVFLAFVQIAAQASGAVAIYLLARDRLADRWLAVVLAAVLLLNPTYQWLTWEFFHPDALAIAPLMFAYWAARAHRWRWFVVAAVLAVACKEDVALAVAAMGIVIAVRENRKIGAITAALATGWFLLASRVLMPAALGGLNPFYDSYFADVGSSFREVIWNTVTRPGTTLDLATRPDRMSYYRLMFIPVALLPFLSIGTLLIAGPMLAINALTSFGYARDYRFHYSALVLAGIMLATVEAIAWVGRTPNGRRFLVGLVGATTLAASVAWGPSPISIKYRQGFWPLLQDARHASRVAAVDTIPEDAAVSAQYPFNAHLTHRVRIYDFPEPWRHVNWGIRGENLPDPGGVEWIIFDRQLLGDYERRLVDVLLRTEFTARFDSQDIVAAERTARGGRIQIETS